jgi:hypothetical protein
MLQISVEASTPKSHRSALWLAVVFENARRKSREP